MKFVLQWHITERCNFRCKHCYQRGYSSKWPSLEKMKEIFFSYFDIKENFFGKKITKRYINFTWGEPFLREDFLDFLSFIDKHTPFKLNIWILTNWSLIDQKKLNFLKKFKNLNINFQISIEWSKKRNDEIRGSWTFDKIFNAINLCQKNNFSVHLSFTLTSLNQKEIFKLIPIIENFWLKLKIRRLVPIWVWEGLQKYMLSSKEWFYLTIKIRKLNSILQNWYIDIDWCSEVTWYKYNWEWCWINHHRLLVINHDLKIFPCKRLELSLWNLQKDSLKKAFFSDKYLQLINSYKKIEICKNCAEYNNCKWGAKCMTYALNNRFDLPDPQCYKSIQLKN